MNRLTLKHLTFVGGPDVEPATVDFSPRLSVIYGASDTGKSFIVDALDYMLGASSLKNIREAEGYTDVLLGIQSDESHFTLVREVSGGPFRVYSSLVREVPDYLPDFTLGARHVKGKSATISNYLLRLLDMDGRVLRKNARNEVVSLSMRNVVRLCLIHEGEMVAVTPPIFSGQYVNKTVELSTFRLLVEGEDDSNLPAPGPSDDARKISRGKIEVLQQVLDSLYESVLNQPPADELSRQLTLLDRSLEEQGMSVEGIVSQRDALVARRAELVSAQQTLLHRTRQMRALIARFDLLRSQYESDLARLATVQEAGSLLGFFRSEVCVFCGASSEHQNPPGHAIAEATNFALSIAAEADKTTDLLNDLRLTIVDLNDQLAAAEAELVTAGSRVDRCDREIRGIEEILRPRQTFMAEMYRKRSAIEHLLNNYAQIERIETIARPLEAVPAERLAAPKRWPSPAILNDFCASIGEILLAWGIPHDGPVLFDQEAEDLVVDGKLRGSRGKGMRSILHAAFTLGLAEYCIERDLQHPGFVVLDSPLVTYREPDSVVDAEDEGEEFVTPDVASAFYRYVDTEFDGQAIVIENTTPPSELSDTAEVLFFTKIADFGRYGFFPMKGGGGNG